MLSIYIVGVWGGNTGGVENSVSIAWEILKVIDADEVGGFLIPTKQLQNTLKFLSLIGSRLKHQL